MVSLSGPTIVVNPGSVAGVSWRVRDVGCARHRCLGDVRPTRNSGDMSRYDSQRHRHDDGGRVDCNRCPVRGIGCGDCVVTILLGPPSELDLAPDERRALDVLAQAGLVPPLRHLRPVEVEVEHDLWGSPAEWEVSEAQHRFG